MGKPSRTHLSEKSSEQSVDTSTTSEKSSTTMGNRSFKKKRRLSKIHKNNEKNKLHKQKQQKIDKLTKVFDELRNQSGISLDSSQNNTVIVLDDTIPNNNNETKKRKLSDTDILAPNKCQKFSKDLVIVDDDVLIVNSSPCNSLTPRKNVNTAPIDCSTPIAKRNTSLTTETIETINADVENLTKEINRDSYLTIDLTTESNANNTNPSTLVIDVENTSDAHDCTLVSVSNDYLSMSGDSDVTVLQNSKKKRNSGLKNMSSFVNGIAKLNASEKGQLLEMITQKIFNGCKVPKKLNSHVSIVKDKHTETAEDTYIKEIILGEKRSNTNSIGSNIYNPSGKNKTGLRMIVIDGSNVAMQHSGGRIFSVKGLKICIDYFLKRGHVVKAFVPQFRCKWGKSSEPRLLDTFERRGLVVYTPSREVQGKMITSYDDRYIVQCAAEFDGVIVSGDNYRDLLRENPRWKFVIENRLLPFTWVNDMIMFPRDPLGRYGPSLEEFLRHPTQEPILKIV